MQTKRMWARAGLALVLAFVASQVSGAPGEWPIPRHDSARLGTADFGSSFATAPTPTWRHYVGGSMSQYVMADVNEDGAEELIYLAGGVLYHKTADNELIWSRQLAADALYGPMDLDGNGDLEVLTVQSTPVRIYVVSVLDGSILWTFNNSSEIGSVGALRVRDLDLDGTEDLLIEECHCCTYNSGRPGFAMRFDKGFSSPTRMYDVGSDCGSNADLFVDLDGTGQQYFEIGYTSLKATDTATGQVKYSISAEMLRSNTQAFAQDLDGDGTDEIPFINYYYYAGQGVPRFGVWDYSPSTGLRVLWERKLSDPVNDRVEGGVQWLADLDGDAKLEMALSLYSKSADVWTLYVFDALTGTPLGQLIDHRMASLAQLDTTPALELLTFDERMEKLYAWRWSTSGFLPLWSIADRALFYERSEADGKSTYYNTLVTLDQDGDGQPELPLRVWDETGNTTALSLVDPSQVVSGKPLELGESLIPAGLEVERALRCDGFDELSPGLCQVRTDGYLQALAEDLTVLNQDGPEPDFLPGMQLGGYLPNDSLGSYPLVSRFKSTDPALVWTRNSQGYNIALDPTGATLFTPGTVKLSFESITAPSLTDLEGDGNRELLFIDKDGRLHCRRSDGKTDVWTATWAPDDASAPFGIAVGDADGNKFPDVYYAWYTSQGYSKVRALDGRSGFPLWTVPFAIQAQWGAYPFSLADMDKDGDTDLVTTWNYLYVVDGKTGTTLVTDSTFQAYGVPMPYNTDGDATLEILQGSGYYPDRLLNPDFTARTVSQVWRDTDGLRTGQQGAIVKCSSTDVRLVKGYSSDDRFQVFNLLTGARLADWHAAGGKLFATTTERDAAGLEPGILTHMVTSPDLTGSGVPAAVFGSSDGYLYALDACASPTKLLWAYKFGPRVGAPILADTDDDGRSELLVHVGDGYLYHFSTPPQAAPEYVLDLESETGTADVDSLVTLDSLYASWAESSGASSYQVGVLSAANSFVTTPNFLSVGATSTKLSGLKLCNGATYRVAVRAVGSVGASPEVLSDGVKVKVGEKCDGVDNNCDGKADEGFDGDGDGVVSCKTDKPADCNDADPLTYPGADELCDGLDNNCDGLIDNNAVDAPVWYGDTDKDGYGNPEYDKIACTQPRNFVSNNLDCDDTEKGVYPGAPEVCDELDNDCDGTVDEDVQITVYADEDDDGYGDAGVPIATCALGPYQSLSDTDCDDSDASVRPGQIEACDGIDQNCDGQVDEGVQGTWYADADGDTYGDPGTPVMACSQPGGTVVNNQDCDDTQSSVMPGAAEVCDDGIDQDCSGYDLGCNQVDDDKDGYTEVQGDCNDGDSSIHPLAPEVPYNGIDEDCSGADLVDVDGDGFAGGGGADCVDSDAAIHPNAEEICDGVDNNCDGNIDDRDADVDGAIDVACGGLDCNDENPETLPGALEGPDGEDNDCDGVIDEGTIHYDDDGDHFSEVQGDCSDGDPTTYPSATELADGVDNDCDTTVDEGTDIYDDDLDGYAEVDGDCDDDRSEVNPGASEVLDGLDNNCDDLVDEGTEAFDDDGDGYSELQGDCDDARPEVNPGQEEVLEDGLDNDCDGVTDELPPTPTEVPETPTVQPETPTEVPETPTEVPVTPTPGAETPTEQPATPTAVPETPTEAPTEAPASPTVDPTTPTPGDIPPDFTPTATPPGDTSGGCSCNEGSSPSLPASSLLLLGLAGLGLRRRSRKA